MTKSSLAAASIATVSIATVAFAGFASVAHAESPSVRLARLLEPIRNPVRRHPLADATGRIPFLVEIGSDVDPASLGLRRMTPTLAAGRLSPTELFWFSDDHPDLPISITPGAKVQLDHGRITSGVPAFIESVDPMGEGTSGLGAGVVVGVVDTGIDITHPGFLDEDGHTRIAWLLTWGAPTGKHPEVEEALGCTDPDQRSCAVWSAEDIDEILASGEEIRADLHDVEGHGTHVASIAAGNGGTGGPGKPAQIGMAPKASLVIAAPSETASFADSEILLGTRFIFDRADAMGMPAVVNLSLGGDYGPHDGTSFLEKGVAEFIGDDKPGRAVVVAAGNSGGLYEVGDITPLGVHTEIHVEEHAGAFVPVYVPGAEGGNVYVWITFRPGDDVRVGLGGPDGESLIRLVGPGEEAGYEDDDKSAAVINNLVNDHSSISADTNSAVVNFSGTWAKDSTFALELQGKGDAQLWVVGQGAAEQGAYFVQATKQGTVNEPASHPRLLSVGCTVDRNEWFALDAGLVAVDDLGGSPVSIDGACFFSGAGPTPLGVPKPEISAPGAFIIAAMSADADPRVNESSMFSGVGCPDDTQCYVVDDHYAIASGTSMSAPFVTGAAALLFEQNPNLTEAQVIDVLQTAARKPKGKVPYGSQIGVGALDVSDALHVLQEEEESGSGAPPDASKSWFYLSSENARPDPSWTITGNVELRRPDGSVASGLDGTLLGVEVEGGLLVEPPVKVRHGFFRFKIAGDRGAGGTSMTVRVTYAGRPIGDPVAVPIAIDAWADDATPVANGGMQCAAASPASSRASTAPLVASIAIAAGLLGRRRRRP